VKPADLADANLVEAVREHARWQRPCQCIEEAGLVTVIGPNAFPIAFRNCVLRLDAKLAPAEVIERAKATFWPLGRGFTVLVRASRDADIDAALRASGIAPAGEAPCMLAQQPVPLPPVPAGVRVERFSQEHQVRDATRINAQAYETIKLPAAETRVFFAQPAALLSPRVAGFIAYAGADPLSTALTIFSGRSAGVYWVGTAAHAQRRGLGGLCTALATNAGFAAGAAVVTLQATTQGEPVYRKLGYTVYDRLARFRHPAPS